jgi:hypothetical protein
MIGVHEMGTRGSSRGVFRPARRVRSLAGMTDRSQGPEPGDDGRFYERESRGLPRWVKITLIVAAVAILLLGIVMITGGGGHRPRRHGALVDGGDAPTVTSAPVGYSAGHAPVGGHG